MRQSDRAADTLEAEKFLTEQEVAFVKRPDGTLFVPGELYIASIGFEKLPDLSCVEVGRGFTCAYNRKLKSLHGSPYKVNGYYSCYECGLETLEGMAQEITGNISCHDNNLVSLRGAPPAMKKRFICHNNKLECLEGAPKTFKDLTTDFGTFHSWDEVPEHLRFSAATRERMAHERAAMDGMVVMPRRMPVSRPLRFK